jgi:hypothetical protein
MLDAETCRSRRSLRDYLAEHRLQTGGEGRVFDFNPGVPTAFPYRIVKREIAS